MSHHMDQVSTILRNTHDGDVLDPSDLALVQAVVNGGPSVLSSNGRIHWDQLVERTANGTYNRQWFCGIEHLTRDHVGYVYWKGRRVEHYSYSRDRKHAEIQAAKTLAAICLRVESLGQEVSSGRVMQAFDQLRFGEGLSLPRFVVLWHLRQQGPLVKVRPTGEVAWDRHVLQLAEVVGQTSAEWGVTGSNGVRVQTVVTREDLMGVLKTMELDSQWAQRVWFGSASTFRTLGDQVAAMIHADALATRKDVDAQLLGPFLARLSIASIPEGAFGDIQPDAEACADFSRAVVRQ